MTSGEHKELMGFLERKFEGMDGRFDSLESRVDRNSEDIRELSVLVDRNYGLIQTVAEGVVTVDRKLDRKVDELRADVEAGFRGQSELLTASHRDLDRRLRVLERQVDRPEEGR